MDQCIESALEETLRRAGTVPRPRNVAHRVPLGLLLLSRQALTAEQLREALQRQRRAGRGKIGEWLQNLGFVNEQQVTAALAHQWSCPVLRVNSSCSPVPEPHVPRALLEKFTMIPVNYVESSTLLHVAFGEGIDYRVLFAIEQMLECRTEPCMAPSSFVRASLQIMSARQRDTDIVFERVNDAAEISRIIRSYCHRLSATEIRIANCQPYIWSRLFRPGRPSLDVLMRMPLPAPAVSPLPSPDLSIA